MVARVPIKYKDLENNPRMDNFYFSLSKSEIAEWELEMEGGLSGYLEKLQALAKELAPAKEDKDAAPPDSKKAHDVTSKIAAIVKEIILRSYGEKSEDGRRFIKSKEISEAFYQTDAYSELFTKFMTDAPSLTEFIKAILPAVPQEETPIIRPLKHD